MIGILAGSLSTFGFAVIQSRFEAMLKKTDTCGVMYLHGLPGLMGGVAAAIFMESKGEQFLGIGLSVAIALIGGYVVGKILAVLGRRSEPYVDSVEFDTGTGP